MSVRNLIRQSNVTLVCTTDDPIDSLEWHQKIAADETFDVVVAPSWRPDKAMNIEKPEYLDYLAKLAEVSGTTINSFADLKAALVNRLEYFNAQGCNVSDHALEYVPFEIGDANAVFEKKMNGGELSEKEINIFKTAMLKVCATEYEKLGWTMQLHIGALRNNNTKMYNLLGADTGFDSINDLCIAEKLSAFMNYLDTDDILPKTILYTLNPKDNFVIGTMLGNFQKAPTPGKIQFGSGWWFNDQRDGMVEQMKALANLGMISRFVGMLTDSRSFVSYPRHEYFRRIMCNLIGKWVEEGEYPEDYASLEKIVQGIAYYNAKRYFNF